MTANFRFRSAFCSASAIARALHSPSVITTFALGSARKSSVVVCGKYARTLSPIRDRYFGWDPSDMVKAVSGLILQAASAFSSRSTYAKQMPCSPFLRSSQAGTPGNSVP